MLDADAVINNSFQKVGGSNAYPDPAPKKVGGSGPRKTHRIYVAGCSTQFTLFRTTVYSLKLDKYHSKIGDAEIAGVDNAGVDNDEGYCRCRHCRSRQ